MSTSAASVLGHTQCDEECRSRRPCACIPRLTVGPAGYGEAYLANNRPPPSGRVGGLSQGRPASGRCQPLTSPASRVDRRRYDAGPKRVANQSSDLGHIELTGCWLEDQVLGFVDGVDEVLAEKMRVADHAGRLLPSTRAWLRTSELEKRGGLVLKRRTASSPKTVTRGRPAAAAHCPASLQTPLPRAPYRNAPCSFLHPRHCCLARQTGLALRGTQPRHSVRCRRLRSRLTGEVPAAVNAPMAPDFVCR